MRLSLEPRVTVSCPVCKREFRGRDTTQARQRFAEACGADHLARHGRVRPLLANVEDETPPVVWSLVAVVAAVLAWVALLAVLVWAVLA